MRVQVWKSLVRRLVLAGGLCATSALAGTAEDIQRNWKPDCEVEGGRGVIVRVTFTIAPNGAVVGDVIPQVRSLKTPVSQDAADRAVRAVYASAPFRDLPKEFYGEKIIVQLNASEACS